MEAAGTNLVQSHYTKGHDLHCPSCAQKLETCIHVLMCKEAGRVDAMTRSIGWLEDWLRKVGTESSLRDAITLHAQGRGGRTMEEITSGWGSGFKFKEIWRSQDLIGWRRFMKCMITKEMLLASAP